MLVELRGIVNPTLRERIDKAIVEKLINAKVNFGLGLIINAKVNFAPIKEKEKSYNLMMTLQMNSINQSLENIREG